MNRMSSVVLIMPFISVATRHNVSDCTSYTIHLCNCNVIDCTSDAVHLCAHNILYVVLVITFACVGIDFSVVVVSFCTLFYSPIYCTG